MRLRWNFVIVEETICETSFVGRNFCFFVDVQLRGHNPKKLFHREVGGSILDHQLIFSFPQRRQVILMDAADWTFCILHLLLSADDVPAAKRLLQAHLRSSVLVSSHVEVCFRDICYDLRTELGSIEAVEDSEQSCTYQLITNDNAQQVIVSADQSVVVASCDSHLYETYLEDNKKNFSLATSFWGICFLLS